MSENQLEVVSPEIEVPFQVPSEHSRFPLVRWRQLAQVRICYDSALHKFHNLFELDIIVIH
jgi:hypothetical protein